MKLEIKTGLVRACVNAAEGGVLTCFAAKIHGKWRDVFRNGEAENSRHSAALFVMAPLVNRTASGRFRWLGAEFDLHHPFRPDDALHHTQFWAETRVAAQSVNEVVLEMVRGRDAAAFPYPSEYRVLTTYRTLENCLEVAVVVENTGEICIPAGPGTHMMCMKSIGDDHRPLVQYQAGAFYPAENHIPTGEVAPLPEKLDYSVMRPLEDGLDDCVSEWAGQAVMRYPESGFELRIEDAIGNCSFLQVWCAEGHEACALEPMPVPPDAVNLASDVPAAFKLPVIEPGESYSVLHRYAVCEI